MRQANSRRAWPIYLFGAVGRGKSFAAALAYVRCRGTVTLLPYCDLINMSIRVEKDGEVSRMLDNGQCIEFTPGQWWRWLSDVGLLIVDEIGTGMQHEWRAEMLWKVLEVRKDKPLIMTANLTPDGIKKHFDDARIHSRISAGTLIEVVGIDQRRIGLTERVQKIDVSTRESA